MRTTACRAETAQYNRSVSIVVVGGGVIGYSVAELLARRGADVLVVDMRGPGAGATQASAGMLVPYLEGHHEALLTAGVRSLALYDEFIARLVDESGLSIEYARCGSLQVAQTEGGAGQLARAALHLRGAGVEHTYLSGQEARELEPALGPLVSCGLLVPQHGYVHVGDLMAALVRSCERQGVSTLADRVEALRYVGDRWMLELASGDRWADAVVVAAGSWSGQLGLSHVPVKPIRGQTIEVAAATPPLGRVVWGEDCYLVPWRRGSTIAGATVEDVGFDETPTESAATTLRAAAGRIVPSLAAAPLRRVRAGLRPATADELPLVGWSHEHPRLMLATGHYRNGILLAPLTARLVVDALLDEPNPDDALVRTAVDPGRPLVLS